MKNAEIWKPTKYEIHRGILRASRNTKKVLYAERLITDAVGRLYTEWIPQYCGGKFADIGCGNAPFYGFYKDYVSDIVTVDWENSIHRNPFVDIFADLNQPPIFGLKDAEFETVLCSDVLEHLSEPRGFLREMARILRPGGKLLLNAPFLYWVHEEPYDFFRYTQFALEKMLTEAGFRVVELRALGTPLDVVATFTSIITLYGLGIFGRPLGWLNAQMPSFFYAIPGLRKKAEAFSSFLPLGFAAVAERK